MENLNKQFYNYLWAYILVALSGCLGNVVDGIIVGNLISEDGVSAINLSKPIIQFIYTLQLLIGAGGGMLVGFALGHDDKPKARRLFTRALGLSVGLGVVISLAGGLIWPDAIARFLCNDERILPLARDYMRVMLLGNPMFLLMWGLSTMVGVDGWPKLVSVAVIIDNVVNLSLDIVFIQWLGWGIAGSSAATVVGHVVGVAILLFFWLRWSKRRLSLNFAPKGILSDWSRIVSQGAPLAIASICLTLLLFVANKMVLSSLGRTGIFAFAVCMNLLQIYNLYLAGTRQMLQTLGSTLVGQGDWEGFRLVLRKAFRFITQTMLVTCMVVWIFPAAIARLFGADEPGFINESVHALRVLAIGFMFFCYIDVLMVVYKLFGHHGMALYISLALSLTVIPVLWIMARVAPNQIWFSYPIAYAIEVLSLFILHKVVFGTFRIWNMKADELT